MAKKLTITQTKSTIDSPDRQRRTLEALGIRRMHHSVEHEDSHQVRGMIRKVRHLVDVKESK